MSYAQMLLEKRANVWEQAKGLLDAAANEKRELTADEQQTYDRMTTDLGDLRKMVDKITADTDNAKATEDSLRALADQPVVGGAPKAKDDTEAQLRSFLKGETRAVEFSGNPTDIINKRALGGSGAAGTYTEPTTFYGKLWANLINSSEFLQSGITVLTTENGNQINIPATSAHSTAAWTAAGNAMTESDPVFAQRTLNAYKATTLITVDQELIDDTGVDLQGYLAMQAGRAVGNLLGTACVTGTGTTQPTGITTLTTAGVTGATGKGGNPSFDDVINLLYSVIPQYRKSPAAAFVAADTSIGFLRTLKDSYGQYLWAPGLTSATPDTILGKPVVQEVAMPALGLSAKGLLFGDLSAYFARIVSGIRFESSRDFAFSTDQVTFRCVLRGDGTLVDQTGAVKHFIGGAS